MKLKDLPTTCTCKSELSQIYFALRNNIKSGMRISIDNECGFSGQVDTQLIFEANQKGLFEYVYTKIISEECFLEFIKEPLTEKNKFAIKEYLLNKEYTIAIDIEEGINDVGIIVLDLPGCFSASNPFDIIENASEAIKLHIDGILEDGIKEGENYLTSKKDIKNLLSIHDLDPNMKIVKIKLNKD